MFACWYEIEAICTKMRDIDRRMGTYQDTFVTEDGYVYLSLTLATWCDGLKCLLWTCVDGRLWLDSVDQQASLRYLML